MAETFDAYRKWLGIPPHEQPPNHYRLLGIGLFESDPDVISNAADRQMVHVRSFQGGRHSDRSQEILNELAAARVCLLDPNRKVDYDQQLRSRMAAKATVPSGIPVAVPVAPQPIFIPPPPLVEAFAPPQAVPVAPQAAPLPALETTRPVRSVSAHLARRRKNTWQAPVTILLAILAAVGLVLLFLISGSSTRSDSGKKPPPRSQRVIHLDDTGPRATSGR